MPAPALGPRDVGAIVTLRVRTARGPTDVVGRVIALSATAVTVLRRDGAVEEVPLAAVEAGRRVPPTPAQRIPVGDLQRIAACGWRALDEQAVGDWLLRASGGFTRRANSALALGDPGTPVAAAVDAVRRWYADRGLPPTVHTPAGAAAPDLVGLLDAQRWATVGAASVMTAEIAHVLRAHGPEGDADGDAEVRLDDAPDEDWLALYRHETGGLPAAARSILVNHPSVVFASVRDGGRCVAIARASVDDRWAGLFAVEVATSHRRRGLGRTVSAAALRWAGRRGARHVHLQAEADNAAAIAMYERLGFSVHHDYVFRVDNVER